MKNSIWLVMPLVSADDPALIAVIMAFGVVGADAGLGRGGIEDQTGQDSRHPAADPSCQSHQPRL